MSFFHSEIQTIYRIYRNNDTVSCDVLLKCIFYKTSQLIRNITNTFNLFYDNSAFVQMNETFIIEYLKTINDLIIFINHE